MPGGFHAKFVGNKSGHGGKLMRVVIETGDEQGGHLHKDAQGFHELEVFLDRLNPGLAVFSIKAVIKGIIKIICCCIIDAISATSSSLALAA